MIDHATIEKVIDTAQIVDVVSEFVSLKRRGLNYVGLCPFHNEKTPSFSVSPTKNICKCFSCGKGGDSVHFLMEHEQMTFPEAIRWLAHKYNIEIEERKLSEQELLAQTNREGMMMINELAQKTFSSQLYDTKEGRDIGLTYFYERGFHDEIIKKFQLGYSLDAKSHFAKLALDKGLKLDYLLSTGICYGGENGELPIDRFRGRVMFPIHSLSGKVIGFGGRVLLRTSHTAMKYVNSPESEIYHKSDTLYGISFAKSAIASHDCCFLVEGYTDVLSMHQAGIENVVASSGTSLTPGQIQLIRRFTKNVTILYDGDNAGINASMRGIDMFLKEGLNVKVLLLPDDDDPDSFARKHTSEEFLAFIAAHEVDAIHYKIKRLGTDSEADPIKRANMIRELVHSIAIIPDSIVRTVYVQDVCQRLNFNEQVFANSVMQEKEHHEQEERIRKDQERRRSAMQSAPAGVPGSAVVMPTVAPDVASDAMSDEPNLPDAPVIPSETELAGGIAPVLQAETPLAPAVEERRPLLTDRFERNIIRYIVRNGGDSFTLVGYDESNQPIAQQIRVIDFVDFDLRSDGITFQHPLYAKMLQLALDASEDPQVEFNSAKFFSSQRDDEVRKTSIDLLADKYGTVADSDIDKNLDQLVPRSILELKDAIIRSDLEHLRAQLKDPQADVQSLIVQINEKTEIRKILEKDLGERIITL